MDWIFLELPSGPEAFKVEQLQDSCTAYLWDLKSLFVEVINNRDLLKRANDLNRNFENTTDSLQEIFRTRPKNVSYSDDNQLKLKYYVQNIPFHFSWNFKENENPKDFSNIVGIPLLIALKHTKDREEELLKIIQQKDTEILDYKTRDPSLINKFIETKPLNVKGFNKSTPWDSILQPSSITALSTVIPDIANSGYCPTTDDSTNVNCTQPAVIPKQSRNTKHKILKRIQGHKIGTGPVELKYSQDSQELALTDEEDQNPPQLQPPTATAITKSATQSKVATQSGRNKRKLCDVFK